MVINMIRKRLITIGCFFTILVGLLTMPAFAQTEASPSADQAIEWPVLQEMDHVSGDFSSYENMFRLSYKSLIDCYGEKIHLPTCIDKKSGDVNDDGKMDEVDYNMIMAGFAKLNQKKILVSPTPLPPTLPTNPVTPEAGASASVSQVDSPYAMQILALSKVCAFGGIVSIPAAVVVGTGAALRKRKKKKK